MCGSVVMVAGQYVTEEPKPMQQLENRKSRNMVVACLTGLESSPGLRIEKLGFAIDSSQLAERPQGCSSAWWRWWMICGFELRLVPITRR